MQDYEWTVAWLMCKFRRLQHMNVMVGNANPSSQVRTKTAGAAESDPRGFHFPSSVVSVQASHSSPFVMIHLLLLRGAMILRPQQLSNLRRSSKVFIVQDAGSSKVVERGSSCWAPFPGIFFAWVKSDPAAPCLDPNCIHPLTEGTFLSFPVVAATGLFRLMWNLLLLLSQSSIFAFPDSIKSF